MSSATESRKSYSALSGPWQGEAIAIVGMAGRFPEADDVDQFWTNLLEGRNCIRRLTTAELLQEGVPESLLRERNFVPAGGVLKDIEWFDARFFGISPREAEAMDPQQRILLEVVQHALEDADLDPERIGRRIGVYAGGRLSGYWMRLLQDQRFMASMGWHQVAAGNDKDFLATQVSYRFDLCGPSVNTQAACSTSMLAVSLACDSLIARRCDAAIAGGASVAVPHRTGYLFQPSGIASPDGYCRPFDIDAAGSVLGNGVGVVILKRYHDAVAAGDRIYAIIRGVAVNNDGAAKSSFAAPSVRGQADVIAAALRHAGVTAHDVDYVETHGTATALGDVLEVGALGKIFCDRNQPCRIGSVKSNVGHLDPAAGVTSIIKVALILHHGEIPATINFQRPNPRIDFTAAGVEVAAERKAWPQSGRPRIAGVSSFGIGGTNVHAVLQEAPAESAKPAADEQSDFHCYALPLSARSAEALRALELQYAGYLEANPQVPMSDIAYWLTRGRRQLSHRRCIVAATHHQAAALLRQAQSRSAPQLRKDREVFFLFPGQGTQRLNAGRQQYLVESVFRETFDMLDDEAHRHIGFHLRDLVNGDDAEATPNINETQIAQPFLFAVEYSLARLWMHWGISPVGMLGHSLGEIVAACIAGVFTPRDAMRIVCERGRLMGSMEPGTMLVVPLDVASARALESDDLRISAFNAPRLHTLSGSTNAIESLEQSLKHSGVGVRRLHTSHAFHHPSMEPAARAWLETLKHVELNPAQLPFLSNLTGDWITPEEATSPEYWAATITAPVKVSSAVEKLLTRPEPILIECGPGASLSSIVLAHGPPAGAVIVNSMARTAPDDDLVATLAAGATVWQAGAPVDWLKRWNKPPASRVSLPKYPFQRQRYWHDIAVANTPPHAAPARDVKQNCYLPVWQRSPLPTRSNDLRSDAWIVLLDHLGVGALLSEKLSEAGEHVVTILTDEDNSSPEAVRELLREAIPPQLRRIHIIACCVDHPPSEMNVGRAHAGIQQAFDAPLSLLQTIVRSGREFGSFVAVTSGLFSTDVDSVVDPTFAPIMGIVRVLSQEMPSTRARLIDTLLPQSADFDLIGRQIADEILSESTDAVVAYRGTSRLLQVPKPATLPPPKEGARRLRPGGTYVITGGFGAIGGVLAKLIASAGKCNLALIGRRGPGTGGLRLQNELERMGASVMSVAADVSDASAVKSFTNEIRQRFGRIDGVIHTAGVPGGGMLATRNLADAHQVFAPKIDGTVALFSALCNDQPDFFILCSSFASLYGGLGQADYCGANAFQDAFAAYARSRGISATAINWPTWREAGMAVAMSLPDGLENLRAASLASGITNAEGVELFASILAADLPQVVVVPFSVATDFGTRPAPPDIPVDQTTRSGNTKTADGAEAVLQTKLGEIWSTALGVPQVDSDDNFFTLGGHSLMALQIISAVNERFPIQIDLRDIFESPDLQGFTMLVHSRLVASVAQMPQEEVQQRMHRLEGVER